MGARAIARALRAKTIASRKCDFEHFFNMRRAGARFPRAQPRAAEGFAGFGDDPDASSYEE